MGETHSQTDSDVANIMFTGTGQTSVHYFTHFRIDRPHSGTRCGLKIKNKHTKRALLTFKGKRLQN